MQYETQIKLRLKSNNNPNIAFGIDDQLLFKRRLRGSQEFGFNHMLTKGDHQVWVEMLDKTNNTPDQHVEIEWVEVEGMRLDRVKWQGIYEPRYPEPWASQQKDLPLQRIGETFLGWNGRWTLKFTTPIYTWLHDVEHLGWIYD